MAHKWSELMPVWREAQVLRAMEPEKFLGVKTSLTELNAITHGYRWPFYGIVIAKNKGGKTAMMLTQAIDFARKGVVVLMISEEMTLEKMVTRAIANTAIVDMNSIEDIDYTETEWLHIDGALKELASLDGYFAYNKRTPGEIEKEIRQVVGENKGRKVLCIIDYAQLLNDPKFEGNEYRMQTSLSRWIRSITLPPDEKVLTPEGMLGLTGERNLSVITALQVSKQEKRAKSRLSESSGRGTGSWEDDADYTLVINDVPDPEGNPLPDVRIVSVGGRFTAGGEFKVRFRRSQARFEDYIESYSQVKPVI